MRAFFQNRYYLVFELIFFFAVLPGLIISLKIAPMMLLFLWGGSVYCMLIYRYVMRPSDPLWHFEAFKWAALWPVLLRWVVACAAMTGFLALYNPDRLFSLLGHDIGLMLRIFLLYPVLSALPQEFIYCSFFFRRYRALFKSDRALMIASAILFALAHCLYINPVAPAFSLIAGFIFASTYIRTRSLALVSFEHALYGNALFLIGLGVYFYSGGVSYN